MKGFLKDGLSIDEFRVSALIGVFIGLMIAILISYFIGGDIAGESLIGLAETLIYIIGGVNVANGVMNYLDKSKTKKVDDTKSTSSSSKGE